MKRFSIVFVLAGLALGAARFNRAGFAGVEKSFDQRIVTLADDPYLLVGDTRGVYLEGYGAVFTAEVNLANGPSLSPFRPTITKEDMARIRSKKLERFPALRQRMQDALLDAAASLTEVPANEQIVIGISLLYRAGEDVTGMHAQILIQGLKSRLLQAKIGQVGLEQAVQERDF
jgi:hypothetical protein